MGFFKDFKEDLSQAVNELLPDDDLDKDTEEQIVNTLDAEEDLSDESANNEKMKEWLEEFIQEDHQQAVYDMQALEETNDELEEPQDKEEEQEIQQEVEEVQEEKEEEKQEEEEEDMDDNIDLELLEAMSAEENEEKEEKVAPKVRNASVSDDDVTVISKGTSINGSITTDGSLDIMGTINGDVECLGKLSITGKVVGNASAAEVYLNTERMEGSITSDGSVKIGLGTVVIGDILATSGVIAGAVKGEIDINGPIVIDSTAIIKGNIKAKTVQINNGAVIEGFCSLSYSAVDVDNIFE